MNLKISGHHLELTPSLREYVQSKLERIKRHFDNVIDVTVILAVDDNTEKDKRQRAEINLHMRGKDLHVESEAQDMYSAIDLLMDLSALSDLDMSAIQALGDLQRSLSSQGFRLHWMLPDAHLLARLEQEGRLLRLIVTG